MTRKQALAQAIQVLSALEGHEESIKLLQDIYDEYIRIKPASAKDYDKRRSSAAKSWISVENIIT